MQRNHLFAITLAALGAFSLSIAPAQQQRERTVPQPLPTLLATHSMPHYGVKTTFELQPGANRTSDQVVMTIRPANFPRRRDLGDDFLLSPGTQDPRRPHTATFKLGAATYQLGPTSDGIMKLTLPKSDYEQYGIFELEVFDDGGVLIQGVGPVRASFS